MCESVCASLKCLLLPGQDDCDDSSLKMKRNYPLCFLHHTSHALMKQICVCVCVTAQRNSHVRLDRSFLLTAVTKAKENKRHERF